LASLDDLTSSTTLERLSMHYDSSTHTAAIVVRLKNTGTQAMQGPFKIRVIRLDSDTSTPEVMGASNQERGVGAVWDVTTDVVGSRLDPGGTSAHHAELPAAGCAPFCRAAPRP
jgi:hypothetical protein